MIWLSTHTSHGVFFLEDAALLELDKLLHGQFQAIKELRDSQIDEEFKKEQDWYCRIYKTEVAAKEAIAEKYQFKEVASTLKIDGKAFDSFDDAIRREAFNDRVPRFFEAELVAGSSRINLELSRFAGSDRIAFKLTPEDLLANKVKMDLIRWIEKYTQPFHISLWANYHVHWYFLLAFIAWLLFGIIPMMTYDAARKELFKKALPILKEGVNDANRNQAIEVLLRYQTGVPGVELPNYSSIQYSGWALLAGLALIAFLHPRSALGIGKGKRWIRFQKGWIFFVVKILFWTVFVGAIVLGLFKKQLLG